MPKQSDKTLENKSPAELITIIKKLKKRKKYGIVWETEKEPETIVQACRENLSVLKEDPSKEIVTDKTKPTNILIEGDNFHALSVLSYTHKRKIDVIYIDPPYNTGKANEWKYNDKYIDENDHYGHSKWLNFMSIRLKIAKDLLTKTGVIFISIDDNEQAQLKMLCDEIFLKQNFIWIFTWVRKKKWSHLSDETRKMTEYVLAYKRNKVIELYWEDAYKDKWQPLLKRTNSIKTLEFRSHEVESTLPDWEYQLGNYWKWGTQVTLENSIVIENGRIITPFKITWRYVWTQRKVEEEIGLWTRIAINSLGFGFNVLRWDQWEKTKRPSTLINWDVWVGTNEDANEEIKSIFGLDGDNQVFSYAKPVSLISYLLKMATKNAGEATILDFFAWSWTTWQAVLELNKEDWGKRSFILCTNNEIWAKKEKAFCEKYWLSIGNLLNLEGKYKPVWKDWCDKYWICSTVTYPRIQKVIDGYNYDWDDSTLLFQEKLSAWKLKKAQEYIDQIELIKGSGGYDSFKTELNNNTLQLFGVKKSLKRKPGIGGNLKYYKTDFVSTVKTDQEKRDFVARSTEMLCIAENTFSPMEQENGAFAIYENSEKITAIIYDEDSIESCKKILWKYPNKPVSIYVFSYDHTYNEEDFEDLPNIVGIKAIPEAILNVYRSLARKTV